MRIFSFVLIGILSILATTAHATRTGTMGQAEGSPAALSCPNKNYLAGFAVQWDTVLSGLQPYCVDMASDGAWSGGAQIHLDVMMSEALPGGKRLDMFCARDFYVFGFRGYSHVYGIHSIMQLDVICKNVKSGTLTAFGTTLPTGTSVTQWPGAQCPADSVADGVFGMINSGRIIQFGLSCAQTRPAILLSAKVTAGSRANTPTYVQQLTPSILAPTKGQGFFAQSALPIRLAPPQGLNATSYLVAVQRRDPQGNWILQTNLPIAAAVAQSAQGYTGFGAGGTGTSKSLALLTAPGAWRLNAQIAAPNQSGWSDWVEFSVLPPISSAVKTAPKGFSTSR